MSSLGSALMNGAFKLAWQCPLTQKQKFPCFIQGYIRSEEILIFFSLNMIGIWSLTINQCSLQPWPAQGSLCPLFTLIRCHLLFYFHSILFSPKDLSCLESTWDTAEDGTKKVVSKPQSFGIVFLLQQEPKEEWRDTEYIRGRSSNSKSKWHKIPHFT